MRYLLNIVLLSLLLTTIPQQNFAQNNLYQPVTTNSTACTAYAGIDTAINCIHSSIQLVGNSAATGSVVHYTWLNPNNAIISSDSLVTISEPGTYTLQILEQNTGCTSTDQIIITDNRIEIEAYLGQDQPLNCENTFVQLHATGWPSGLDVNFEWFFNSSPIPNETDSILIASISGIYAVKITDSSSGCNTTIPWSLDNLGAVPDIKLVGDTLLDCKDSVIFLNEVLGVQVPLAEWKWTTNDGNIFTGGTTSFSTVINAPGTYVVQLTNGSNGCSSYDSIVIKENVDEPIITFLPNSGLGCQSSTTQIIPEVDLSIGGSFIFDWVGANFTGSDSIALVETADLYSLTVTSEINFCSSTASTTIIQVDGIHTVDYLAQSAECSTSGLGYLAINEVVGANPPFIFSLNNSPFRMDTLYENLDNGNYTLLIQDSKGCERTTDFSINNTIPPSLSFPPPIEIYLGQTIELMPIVNAGPIDYIWNDSLLSCTNCPNPIAQPSQNSSYEVTITNSDGCTASANQIISINQDTSFFFPNAFIPDDSNTNDRFTIFAGKHIRQIQSLKVFDRWGNMVYNKENFQANDPSEAWDGRCKGKRLAEGVYIYQAVLEFLDGKTKLFSGDISIIR